MQKPKITEYLDGDIKVYDEVFTPPELNELVTEVASWSYLYGEVDDVDLPPTGMSTGDYTGTKTFNSLWQFLEEYVPVVHKSVLNYHVDDESDNAWTFMFYANNSWDINQGGETKFITNLRHEYNTTGTEYPEIIAIPPIPGRMIIFKSNILHTATPFKDFHRFTPTIKFVPFDPVIHTEGPLRLAMKETYPWRKDK
jgi:hypothetical protein